MMTPDDEARLRESLRANDDEHFESQLTGQARPNVILEAGMALGICADRTVLVELGKLRPISDLSGRHVVKLNNSPRTKQQLAQRLKNAGCEVDLSGDWLDEGNFEIKSAVAKAESPTEAVWRRIQESLESREKWRTAVNVAYSAGVSTERLMEILQADERVRFTKGSKGEVLVGLKSRVDKN